MPNKNTARPEMIILTRTYDLLTWIVPATDKFPRIHRFVVTQRLLDAALDFQEAITHANTRRSDKRMAYLEAADGCLDLVRLYLRLAHHWHWLSSGQYERVSAMVTEIGRLLGGWMKQTRGQLGT